MICRRARRGQGGKEGAAKQGGLHIRQSSPDSGTHKTAKFTVWHT